MDYILSNVFGQTVLKHGPIVALLAALAFAAVAVSAYYLKTRIDILKSSEGVREAELSQQRSLEISEAAGRERERQALISELKETRQQVHTFLTNHLEHLRQERESHEKVLGGFASSMQAQGDAMREISRDLKDHRTEQAARTRDLYGKLEELNVKVASCKVRGA